VATTALPDGTPAVRAGTAARILGVSENTVRRQLASGRLHGAVVPNGSKHDHLVAVTALPGGDDAGVVAHPPLASGAGGVGPAGALADDTHLLLELSMARSERDVARASAHALQVERDALDERVRFLQAELERCQRDVARWQAGLVAQADGSAELVRALAGGTPPSS
jgi:hypothetical protein